MKKLQPDEKPPIDEKLDEWLNTIEAKKATRAVYIVHMRKFCEIAGKTPTELIADSIAEVKAGMLPAERKSKGYVAKFKKCLLDQGYAPKSQQGALAAIKSFFKSYDMPLSQSISKTKKVQVLEENTGFMNKENVIKLLANAKNLREKAIILCMATSGMAVREIVDLKMKDLKIDNNGIGTIRIRREKSQTDYTTFISPEATLALKNYWEERNRDLRTKINSDDDFVFVSYARKGEIGQLNTITICHIFKIMNDQLKFENKTKSRSHALRKYFASILEDNGFPKVKIDFMMGHTVSDQDKAYFNRHYEKLKELYLTFLPHLTFEKTIEIQSIDSEKLNALIGKNEILKAEIEKLKIFRQELEERLKAEAEEDKYIAEEIAKKKAEEEAIENAKSSEQKENEKAISLHWQNVLKNAKPINDL